MPKNPLTLKDDSFGFFKTREADLDVVQIRPCATERPVDFQGIQGTVPKDPKARDRCNGSLQLWPEIPVRSTNIIPFIECISSHS